jgi:hypothetical protein
LFDEEDARPWETVIVSCRQMYDIFCSMLPDDPPTTTTTTTTPTSSSASTMTTATTTKNKSFGGRVVFGQSSEATSGEIILTGYAEYGCFRLSGNPD